MELVHARTITLSCTVRFENNSVQMITMTQQCVVNKNHVKDLCHSLHLNFVHRFQLNLFASAHNLVIYVGIYKYVAQMIIMTSECVENKNHVTSLKFKVIDYTLTLFIGYSKSLLYPAHNFVLHGGISKFHGKTSDVWEDHVAS